MIMASFVVTFLGVSRRIVGTAKGRELRFEGEGKGSGRSDKAAPAKDGFEPLGEIVERIAENYRREGRKGITSLPAPAPAHRNARRKGKDCGERPGGRIPLPALAPEREEIPWRKGK